MMAVLGNILLFGSGLSSAVDQQYPPEYYGTEEPILPALDCGKQSGDRGFATLVSSGNYTAGAVALAASLAQVSQLPLTIMVTPGVKAPDRAALRATGAALCEVEVLKSPYERCGYLCDSFTKLQAWRLPMRSVVFLDADALVLQSIDDLVGQGGADGVAAAEDCCTGTFNTGVLALRPSIQAFGAMMQRWRRIKWAHSHVPEDDFPSMVGKEELRAKLSHPDHSDQGFLWDVFRDRWSRLPVTDNFLKDCRSLAHTSWLDFLAAPAREAVQTGNNVTACNEVVKAHLKELRVVHYVGSMKPWMCTEGEGDCESGTQTHKIPALFTLWHQSSLHHRTGVKGRKEL